MRLSRSLEGLEKVIPPGATAYPPTRSDLHPHLNKPLPAKPLDQVRTTLSAWSDDSSVESFGDPSDTKDSTESFPIFVSSGSDDLDDPPVESTLDDLDSGTGPPSPALNAFLSEERYGAAHHPSWSQNKVGTSHYFREKKWDFFPELATPSALGNPAALPVAAKARKNNASRLNLPGLDFGKSRSRWHSDNAGSSLAHGVRHSIRSYVSRTLSKDNKPKRRRPLTAPSIYPSKCDGSHKASSLTDHSVGDGSSRQNSLDTYEFGGSSISTDSSTNEHSDDSKPTRRHKQLAVPLSPYQKYGSSIWDKSGASKKVGHHHVRFPKHAKQASAKESKHETMFSSSAPSLSLPHSPTHQSRDYVKALHDGTTHVRGALDDAKRKMTASRADRRREQLKSQIKLVGPVNPYAQPRVDPWI